MFVQLRRAVDGKALATLEDNERNRDRCRATRDRLHGNGIMAVVAYVASMYQNERLPNTGAFVNRSNRRAEAKTQKAFDRMMAKTERARIKAVARTPLFNPDAEINPDVTQTDPALA